MLLGDSYCKIVPPFMLSILIMAVENLDSNRFLIWRCLELLVQDHQKLLQRPFWVLQSPQPHFLLVELGRRSHSGLKPTDSVSVAVLLLFMCNLSSSQI